MYCEYFYFFYHDAIRLRLINETQTIIHVQGRTVFICPSHPSWGLQPIGQALARWDAASVRSDRLGEFRDRVKMKKNLPDVTQTRNFWHHFAISCIISRHDPEDSHWGVLLVWHFPLVAWRYFISVSLSCIAPIMQSEHHPVLCSESRHTLASHWIAFVLYPAQMTVLNLWLLQYAWECFIELLFHVLAWFELSGCVLESGYLANRSKCKDQGEVRDTHIHGNQEVHHCVANKAHWLALTLSRLFGQVAVAWHLHALQRKLHNKEVVSQT